MLNSKVTGVFLIIFLAGFVCASSIPNEVSKISHYAEDYESGNINYAQLVVYLSATRQDLNYILKDVYTKTGKPISIEELTSILGKPTGQTKETWSRRQSKMIWLEDSFPIWDKIIFDGNELQVVLKVYPDLAYKNGKEYPAPVFAIDTKFKLDNKELDSHSIEELKDLLNKYNTNPSDSLAETISQKISDFESSSRSALQEGGNCANTMEKLLGKEVNTNPVNSYMVSIKEEDNQSTNAFFQYCDKCDTFGRLDIKFYKQSLNGGSEFEQKEIDKTSIKIVSDEEYKEKISSLFNEFVGNSKEAGSELNAYSNSWMYSADFQNKENTQGSYEQYRKGKYELIRDFFVNLFDSYSKQKSSSTQREYSKLILESNGCTDCQNKTNEESIQSDQNFSCKKYDSMDCDGKVIFSGKDANGCPLAPICISDKNNCSTSEDCGSSLCGKSECVNGQCIVSGMEGCKKSECNDGDKDYLRCDSQEVLVRKVCTNGVWKETGQECSSGQESNQEENKSSEKEGGCNSKSDCSDNEVCSSNECVALPEKTPEVTEPEQTETNSPDAGITGNVIKSISSFITGFVVSDDEQKKVEEEKKRKEGEIKNDNFGKVIIQGKCWEKDDGSSSGGDVYVQLEGKFGKINEFKKNQDYSNNWCTGELKDAIATRKAIEKSFNQDFAKWFFEEYLMANADMWNQRSQIINTLYNLNAKSLEIIAGDKECSGNYQVPTLNLISFNYETSFGSLNYWEKWGKAQVFRSKDKVDVLGPYMSSWIFPPKEFLEKSLINNPSSLDNSDEPYRGGGMMDDKSELRNNVKLVERVNNLVDKYGEPLNVSLKFIDYQTNQTIIHMVISMDKVNLISVGAGNENTSSAIVVKADFNKLYDLVETLQKENKESLIVRPHWENSGGFSDGFKNVVNAVKTWFKLRGVIDSVEVYPESARSDLTGFATSFFWDAMFSNTKEMADIKDYNLLNETNSTN